MLAPHIAGDEHFEWPFHVGRIDPDKGLIHVLDDITLDLILGELDTIVDFVGYLAEKERLIATEKLGVVAGEENLVALYIQGLCHGQGRIATPPGNFTLGVADGIWTDFTAKNEYKVKKDAEKISYLWDKIIDLFGSHTLAGTLYAGSPIGVSDNEQIVRIMARESRLHRRNLSVAMHDRSLASRTDEVLWRACHRMGMEGATYVFLFFPQTHGALHDYYRQDRREALFEYCFVMAWKHRECERIVGIATEAGKDAYTTFDLALVEFPEWTEELESLADEIQKESEILLDVNIKPSGLSFPTPVEIAARMLSASQVQHEIGGTSRIGRNQPCPCGSGKKFKHCCRV